jgi:hypothetical protein
MSLRRLKLSIYEVVTPRGEGRDKLLQNSAKYGGVDYHRYLVSAGYTPTLQQLQ